MQKVAFITGCSTGIGREMVLQLINKGWKVVATARREETIEVLGKAGCLTLRLDVTDQEQIKNAVTEVMQKWGRIDLLINNAGYGLIAPTIDIQTEALVHQLQTNVTGVIFLIQEIAPVMKAQGGGTIVNTGSISGIAPTPFSGAYCASKAAIHAWSDVLRMELAPFNVKVITLQPGGIVSDFGKNCIETVKSNLKPGSWYGKIEQYIYARANTSQEKATPVDAFVGDVLRKILRKDPPVIIRSGKRSFTLPLMKKILPEKLLDKMMMKKYGLDKLQH
jgi:NAD(P)-dependent dehydrogenase (short-subunit alcohol dehydrogenase family)